MPRSIKSKAKIAKLGKNHPPLRQRKGKRHEAMKLLLGPSSNLPSAPHAFDEEKVYRIKVTNPVTPAGHQFPFRPSQDIQVTGKVANEIKEFISGAAIVG